MDVELESVVCSIIIAFISFFFWSRLGSRPLYNFIRQTTTPITTTTTPSTTPTSNTNNNIYNHNTENIDLSNNNNNTNNTNNQIPTTPISTTPYTPEPYEETFSPDDNDLTKIKIIQSENVFHRTFRTSKIITVYDLKRYFYPKEIQDNKRILFIYNGRPMTDSHLLTEYPNLINGINGTAGCIHCLIKEQLTSDQVDNHGTSGNGYHNNNYHHHHNNVYSSSNNNSNSNNNNHSSHSNNEGIRRNVYNNQQSHNNSAYNNDFFTWMCTRTLFILTGLFLTLLWSLLFLTPKLFNNFSSFMLLIFTLFWSICFYSSFKPHSNFQQQQPQPQPTTQTQTQNSNNINHPHND